MSMRYVDTPCSLRAPSYWLYPLPHPNPKVLYTFHTSLLSLSCCGRSIRVKVPESSTPGQTTQINHTSSQISSEMYRVSKWSRPLLRIQLHQLALEAFHSVTFLYQSYGEPTPTSPNSNCAMKHAKRCMKDSQVRIDTTKRVVCECQKEKAKRNFRHGELNPGLLGPSCVSTNTVWEREILATRPYRIDAVLITSIKYNFSVRACTAKQSSLLLWFPTITCRYNKTVEMWRGTYYYICMSVIRYQPVHVELVIGCLLF
jgi:hypothetical protein